MITFISFWIIDNCCVACVVVIVKNKGLKFQAAVHLTDIQKAFSQCYNVYGKFNMVVLKWGALSFKLSV